MADLFGVKKAAISKHGSNIFSQGELSPNTTVSKIETVQIEGKRTIVRNMDYYNLDMILAESRTEEKDTMVKVVVNLINQKN